jgi:hypothetical protein
MYINHFIITYNVFPNVIKKHLAKVQNTHEKGFEKWMCNHQCANLKKHKCAYCEALCNELNFQDEIILDKLVTKEIND